MQEVDRFEQRLKEATQLMSKGQAKYAEMQLKQLQKDVRSFFQKQQINENDRLSQIQIAIYNNLACIFEKRGKYKSSLYHLSLAEKLENAYFTQKYNDKSIPESALEKLATTYCNLSAIQSKLGNSKEALQNIQFGIEIMKKNETLNDHQSFIFLYYNYSVLLEGASRFLEASKYALEGMQIVKRLKEQSMRIKYEDLLYRMKDHLKRQEQRKEKLIQKYTKAETGVFKRLDQLSLNKEQLSKCEPSEGTNRFMFRTLNRKKQITDEFPVYTRQRSSYYKPRVQTQISNRRPRQSISVGVFQTEMKGKIVKTNKGSETTFTNKISQNMNRTTLGIIQAYRFDDKIGSFDKRKKQYSTLCRQTIQKRISEKKQKLQLQISALGQKNEALQKVIQKLYMSQKKEMSSKTLNH